MFDFGAAFQVALKIVRFVKTHPEVIDLVKDVIDLFDGKAEMAVAACGPATCEKPCESN